MLCEPRAAPGNGVLPGESRGTILDLDIQAAELVIALRHTRCGHRIRHQNGGKTGCLPSVRNVKLPGTRAIRVDLNEVERLLEVIPAAKRQPRKPFGPDARIVQVVQPVEVVRAEVVE